MFKVSLPFLIAYMTFLIIPHWVPDPIYTLRVPDPTVVCEHEYSLHSNMVLLIQRPDLTCEPGRLPLHSNMVLLIRSSFSFSPNSSGFTFQYGSINTQKTNLYLRQSLSLHSNMVLLILVFHKCLSHKHYSTTFCRPCHFLFFRDP